MHPMFYIAGACAYAACRPKKRRRPPVSIPPPSVTGDPGDDTPPPPASQPTPGVLTSPPTAVFQAAGARLNRHRRGRRRLTGMRRRF
jgi:hypothetical protein